ncbi:MAG: toll/interleukin-1 receptor domain-containing protein [Saprospiraceae bacterium]|nr:toll/interleukin-1 receptor domain-containing protein [Saprospiraceae bacterium]
MREQIQQLIADGRTEEALDLLEKTSQDAVLLKARYNNGKKQYNMGMIDFSEWNRIQNQVNYAALELAGSGSSPVLTTVPAQPDPVAPPVNGNGTSRKAFISYSHKDQEVAKKVTQFLESNQIDVVIDDDDLSAGQQIMEFIQQSIRNCDAVVTIVSAHSLQSGWVGQESVSVMYAVWLADTKFIPVRLDDVAFDIDFQIAAQEGLNQKIEELDAKLAKLRQLGGNTSAFDDDRNRLFELKNNLGKIIQRLNSVKTVDISGPNFEINMPKVLSSILAK